jgi:NAD(P)-dependent dehydrogenase (short-subunit alcohol dehydrogenase family)
MDIAGKVVVITGGSTGIGRATAELLASEGARLVLAARRTERLEDALASVRARGAEVVGVATDVADRTSVATLAEKSYEAFGQVDIAFFNAGIAGSDNLLEPDLTQWTASIDTNLYGLLHCIKEFVPRMVAQGTPCSVLATSSAAGVHGTMHWSAPYAVTKNAQLSVMECLYGQARDAQVPVHVGIVLPPLTRTNLAGDDMSVWDTVEQNLRQSGSGSSLIEPEEFAHVVRDGIVDEEFWIEITRESSERYMGGRNAGTIEHRVAMVNAKAAAMADHLAPDSYLR